MKEVEARLKISAVDKTGAALKSVAGKLATVNARAEEYNKRSGAIARVQQRSGAMIAAGAAAIAFGAKTALVDFAAIERQMARIGNTAGASADDTKAAFAQLQQETKNFALPLGETISALDTLTASGMNLKEAMAFLPTVLATAQASGATTEDIANAGLKAASAFKIQANQMQRAFDLMVAGGQAGQYELNDMAGAIPRLAGAFSALGYTGEDGLKRLVAVLQTIREDTGSSEEAATNAENVFQKMFSGETINKFKNFGIDLQKEMKKAKENGEDTLTAFIRLSKQAVNGDLSKLPQLFADTQLQNGMRSLMTSAERLAHYMDELGNPSVNGTTYRNLQNVLAGTQASIDKFNASYQQLKYALGGTIAPVITPIMDEATKEMDLHSARQKGMEKRGWSSVRRAFGVMTGDEPWELAYEGGYRDPEFLKQYWARRYASGKVAQSTGGPHGMSPPGPAEFPGGDHGYRPGKIPANAVPIPTPRPTQGNVNDRLQSLQSQYQQYGEGRHASESFLSSSGATRTNAFEGIEERFAQGGRDAGNAIEQSGSKAGDAMAMKLSAAGDQVATAIAGRVLEAIVSGIKKINGLGQQQGPNVNANTGRTMPPSANRPANSGGGGF
ncbi:hypothetical protein ASC97_01270 [Rhizobium sp. Root1203]|uniref:phage tail tape measure protein n=1 Tax=Rhizobium sp. Root1203 TaxID=1736427 RepID=UPI0007109897|nr:phage tail tape measure protein [Rhizobium sp. Root1203]KQV32256.1 hypothetical protein ASC97_01270 [Rhizobium sp. Root1203]